MAGRRTQSSTILASTAFSCPSWDEHSVFFEHKTGEIGQTRKWEGRRVELDSLAVIAIAQMLLGALRPLKGA